MGKTAIRLTMLSIILLLSISGAVLGHSNYATNGTTASKSPGFGSAISIVLLLLAIYIGKRR